MARLAQIGAQHENFDRRLRQLDPRAERGFGVAVVTRVGLAPAELDVASGDGKRELDVAR